MILIFLSVSIETDSVSAGYADEQTNYDAVLERQYPYFRIAQRPSSGALRDEAAQRPCGLPG